MHKKLNRFLFLFVILAMVMTSAIRTTTVYADDGSTEPPTGESTPPPSEEGASVEETSPAAEPVAATEVPAAEPVAEEAVTEPAAEEPTAVAEVLEQLPEGTDLVVVNAAGEAEPLASAEAAQIVATGDPMWCPASATPGDVGCTSSFADFASLIVFLTANPTTYNGAGVIWVEDSYNGEDNAPIIFDGETLTGLNNNNLTINGGWSGGNNTNITGTSLADVSLSFVNWTGDITINNLDIDVTNANTSGSGLYINTVGNITLNNVNVVDGATNTKGSGYGAVLINTRNSGTVRNVTVNNSNFNSSSRTGLYIDSFGTATLNTVQANSNGYGLDIAADAGITLDGVTASSNSYFGGILDTTFGTGAISVTNSNFGTVGNGNGWTGLHAVSGSTITLATVTASDNGTNGGYLVAEGNITVSNSVFNGNVKVGAPEDPGLFALSNGGNITLNNVTAGENVHGAGVVLLNNGTGTITVNTGFFNQNGTFGIQAGSENGNITLNNVVASYNQVKGAYLGSDSGNIFINNSAFIENGVYGIYAFTGNGNINLDLVTVAGSDGAVGPGADDLTDYGANLATATGSVSVTNSSFTLNTDVGLDVVAGQQVTLNNVVADHNGGTDVEVFSITTGGPICNGDTPVSIDVTVNGGTFTYSGGYGLMVKPGPQGTLTFGSPATFGNNGWGDYLLDLSQEYEDCTCDPKEEPPSDKGPNIVDVPDTGGPSVEQDCEQYTGTILRLPDGTQVEIGCPFEGFSKLERLLKDQLPGPLGTNIDFETAIALGLIDDQGNVIINENGTVTIKFVIPEDARARRHSVLFWDSTLNDGKGDWMQLPPYEIGTSFPLHPKDPSDHRTILSGVQQVGNNVTVTVNFPGVFVVVGQ